MKNKKGFTLIEILGVVVVLAVIAIIAVPFALNAVETSKKKSFETSVNNVFDSVKIYFNDEETDEIDILDKDLNLSNETLTGGVIYMSSDSILTLENVTNGEYCASGTKNDLIIVEAEEGENPCRATDVTPPTLSLKLNSKTTTSLDIIVDADDYQSGILGYQYSLDGSDWSSMTTDPLIRITGLTKLETIDLYVRAYNTNYDGNNSDITMAESNIKLTTAEVEEINFSISSSSDSLIKELTIFYPDVTGYQYSYEIDNGIDIKEYSATVEQKVIIEENVTVKATVKYDTDKETSKSITINGVDSKGPVAHIEYSSTWEKYKKISVIVDSETSGLQTKSYSFDGGQTWQISNEFVYTTNDTLIDEIQVRDKYGNITTEFEVCIDGVCQPATNEITINYIDVTGPVAHIEYSNAWEKTKTVTIVMDSDAVGLQTNSYSFDGGSTWQASNTNVYTSNQTVTNKILIRDKFDNETNEFEVCVGGTCSSKTNVIPVNYIDDEGPTVTFSLVNSKLGQVTCSDSKSGAATTGTSYSLTGTSNVTKTYTCIDNAGNKTTDSHTFIYNSCLTGSNTCVYGCDTCTGTTPHTSCTTYNTTCATYGCYLYKTCQTSACGSTLRRVWPTATSCNAYCTDSGGSYCSVNRCYSYNTCQSSACGSYYTTGSVCIGKSSASCVSWNTAQSCTTTYSTSYYSCNCSSCKTGSNTCVGGYSS